MKDIFDPEVIASTKEIWGLDEENEMRGVYRPTGYPAVISVSHIELLFGSHSKFTVLVRRRRLL